MAERRIWEISERSSVPLGHFEATVTTTPTGLPSVPAEARRSVIRNISGIIYWTDDGSTPSPTHGMKALADEVLVLDSNQLDDFQMVSTGSVNVRVAYYGVETG